MTKRRKSGRKRVQKLKNPLPSPATCGTAKKDVANQKNWGQKVEKHGVFSLFVCRFWTGAFTNRCSPYCFLQWFLKASVTTYQKHRVLAEKCPPPRKLVTFYECHPEDHAEVLADIWNWCMVAFAWVGGIACVKTHFQKTNVQCFIPLQFYTFTVKVWLFHWMMAISGTPMVVINVFLGHAGIWNCHCVDLQFLFAAAMICIVHGWNGYICFMFA